MLHKFQNITLAIILFIISLIVNTYETESAVQKSPSIIGKAKSVIPPVTIYKTRRDYSRNVPVLLSDDKKTVISYPHPMDLMGMASNDVMPIRLHDGYFLDRRGINKNVAFLRITYGSYKKLRQPLSIKEIEKYILDKNPLVEIYSCPTLSGKENIVTTLNAAIDSKTLSNLCK
jgi:hypothetical protein